MVGENKIVFLLDKTLEHTNTGKPFKPHIYHRYTTNGKLCIAECVNSYLGVRKKLLNAKVMEFIVIYEKSHKLALSDTISRWIKDEFGKADINTNVYTEHSCRAASTNKARDNDVSVTESLKRQFWKSENTFRTF